MVEVFRDFQEEDTGVDFRGELHIENSAVLMLMKGIAIYKIALASLRTFRGLHFKMDRIDIEGSGRTIVR